ncbi:hypothetical protein JCM16303_004424 [Sporobolomyces ruberrimus]
MPAKASTTKTKSSKSTSSRSLKQPKSLLPLSQRAASTKQNKKNKVHKAKDVDLRDHLNGEDTSLRNALETKQEAKGPIVAKKQAPKELGPGGSDLAKAMDELEMAFK